MSLRNVSVVNGACRMGKIDKFSMKLQARHSFFPPSFAMGRNKKVEIEENFSLNAVGCIINRAQIFFRLEWKMEKSDMKLRAQENNAVKF